MDIVILGAGLSGCIAAGAFSSLNPLIFERKERHRSGLNEHFAVMRLRSPDISKYLGCFAQEVDVLKSIWFKGKAIETCNVRLLNAYSRKVYGRLGRRSLENLGYVKRYLIDASDVKPENVKYERDVKKIKKHGFGFALGLPVLGTKELTYEPYDFCISTLPLPVTLKLTGMDVPDIFSNRKIYVTRGKLVMESDVHQTIYFPGAGIHIYRATIEGRNFVVESIQPIEKDDISYVLGAFYLKDNDIGDVSSFEQPYGKIFCKDDALREALIYELTEKFRIYSFGRYAIWKAIRADDLVKDIQKIMRLVGVSEKAKNYDIRKESL